MSNNYSNVQCNMLQIRFSIPCPFEKSKFKSFLPFKNMHQNIDRYYLSLLKDIFRPNVINFFH